MYGKCRHGYEYTAIGNYGKGMYKNLKRHKMKKPLTIPKLKLKSGKFSASTSARNTLNEVWSDVILVGC